jgi:hypothetical protein
MEQCERPADMAYLALTIQRPAATRTTSVSIPEDCLHGVAAFVDEEEQFGARWETQHDGTSLETPSNDATAVIFPGI